VKLLILDKLGYVPLSPTGAQLLFEVLSQRYERGSTIIYPSRIGRRFCPPNASPVRFSTGSPITSAS
jgi:hypothetical protein